MIFGRARFADVIDRQLAQFVQENADVIAECDKRLHPYNAAERDEAEELYGDYVDAVETGTELLADLRDHYARTLDEATGAAYETEFTRAVRKRLPRFALELENR